MVLKLPAQRKGGRGGGGGGGGGGKGEVIMVSRILITKTLG